MESEFKVGDKVKIKPWGITATIYTIDDKDSVLPYLVEDEGGQTSWWLGEELELINE